MFCHLNNTSQIRPSDTIIHNWMPHTAIRHGTHIQPQHPQSTHQCGTATTSFYGNNHKQHTSLTPCHIASKSIQLYDSDQHLHSPQEDFYNLKNRWRKFHSLFPKYAFCMDNNLPVCKDFNYFYED